MKEDKLKELSIELYGNWFKDNGYLDVTRYKLESYLNCKNYLKSIIIAELRKKKEICLDKKRYFKIK